MAKGNGVIMTTIAFDGRYIAIDSRQSQGSYIFNDNGKKIVETDRYVIFYAGPIGEQMDEAIELFLNDKAAYRKINAGLIVFDREKRKTIAAYYEEDRISRLNLECIETMGSGGQYAVTAMDCGLRADEAVKKAIERDSGSGGKIHCFDTITGKFIKVKQ
jgi:20S proteasome alpha/beta subunit